MCMCVCTDLRLAGMRTGCTLFSSLHNTPTVDLHKVDYSQWQRERARRYLARGTRANCKERRGETVNEKEASEYTLQRAKKRRRETDEMCVKVS